MQISTGAGIAAWRSDGEQNARKFPADFSFTVLHTFARGRCRPGSRPEPSV